MDYPTIGEITLPVYSRGVCFTMVLNEFTDFDRILHIDFLKSGGYLLYRLLVSFFDTIFVLDITQ